MDFTEALELEPNKYVPEEEPSQEHVPEEVVEPSKYGDKLEYDPSGPFEKHRYRTDICWLVTFLVFLVVWLIVISYAFSKGDVSKWARPMDSVGRICGEDPGVYDKPYLIHYNQEDCQLPDCLVCVDSCPGSDFTYQLFSEEEEKKTISQKETTSTTKDSSQSLISSGSVQDSESESKNKTKIEDKSPAKVTKREVDETSKGASSDQDAGKSSENHDRKPPESTGDNSPDQTKVAEKKEASTKTDANDQNKPTSTQKEANGESKETVTQPDANGKSKGKLTQTEADEQNKAQSTKLKANEESKKSSSETTDDELQSKKKLMICQPGVKLDNVSTREQLDYLVTTKMCAKSYKHLPLIDGSCRHKNETYLVHYLTDSKYNAPKETNNFFSSKWSVLGFILLSGLFAMLIIFLMRFGMCFIYGTISILCAFIIFFYYDQFVMNAESKALGVFLTLVLCVVTIGILAALLLYFRREVCRAAQIMKESHKAIMCIMSTLFLPFILFIVYLLILFLGISVFYTLSSIELTVYKADFATGIETCECSSDIGYKQDSICVPETFDSHCKTPSGDVCVLSGCFMVGKEPKSVGFLHFLNFVGIYWSFYFIVGFGDMILAHVFTTWYWTYNKKLLSYLTVIESFWTVSTFHLGTVAVGSLIIPICSLIRYLLSTLYKRLQKTEKPFIQFIVLNLKCIFDLIDGFLDFINRKAYIMCAIHGTDYFQSARTAYYLIMRNIARVVVVCGITEYMIFIVTMLIAGITTKIAQAYYSSVYDNIGLLTFAVFAGSFVVTWLLMRVVQMAIDTIFICFLEDSERNDGSNEKPYFMTESLIKTFYKK